MSEVSSVVGAAPEHAHPLDDVMLAMDVVDTLRRRQRLVERELDSAGRERDLKDRLRRIYSAQGIEVSDAVLDAGVEALKEDRFTYQRPPDTFALKLARLYVSRGSWGKWVLAALAGVVLVGFAWYVMVIAPAGALPGKLEALHAQVVELARSEAADAKADQLLATAQEALGAGDIARAREVFHDLQQMRKQLEVSYELRVVNRPGKRSGVWRVPDANSRARNYYLIVDAVAPDGRPVSVPITSEETGKTKMVDTWGLRVDQAVFERVAADKQDDGIIQDDILGTKRPGVLTPEYRVSASGAAITDW